MIFLSEAPVIGIEGERTNVRNSSAAFFTLFKSPRSHSTNSTLAFFRCSLIPLIAASTFCCDRENM